MKILPIITNPFLGVNKNNHSDYSQYRSPVLAQPLQLDTVSFQGAAKNAEPLRALINYGIPGIYSGKYVIPQEVIDTMNNKHTFARTIRHIVKALKPYEDRLLDVESQFFAMVKNMAKVNPHYHLEDVIRVLAPKHNTKLIKEQMPVLEEVAELASYMPEEQQIKFDALIDTVCKRMNHEPVVLPFDGKEFRYKLHQIANEYSKKHKGVEFGEMLKIMRLAKKMPESAGSNLKISKVKRIKQNKTEKTLTRKRAELLTKMEIMASESVLRKNADLIRLFTQTRAKIYGTPIVIPFNRKSFIEDIKMITDTLEDTKLAHKINKAAIKLPTSHESVSAFIMKHAELSSEKIGNSIVSPSVGNIDHLVPYSKKGRNCIENYAITTSYFNSERGHRTIAEQLRIYPETYKHCQKYVDRLIELCNDGIFKKVQLAPHYITSFCKLMLKLSPEEKPLILHIDKLKQ